MRIFTAISIVLAIAIALFIYQPFQIPGNETDQGDSQVTAIDSKQAQVNRTKSDQTGKGSLQQQRQPTMAMREIATSQSAYIQKSAQATKRHQSNVEQSKRFSEASLQSNQPVSSKNTRSYPLSRGQHTSKPGYTSFGPTRAPDSGRAIPSQKSNVAGPAKAYSAYAMNQGQQAKMQGNQPAKGSSVASGYYSRPGSQVEYQVSQNTMQSPAIVHSQQYRSQTENYVQQYQKASESVDCTYRDDKLTCR